MDMLTSTPFYHTMSHHIIPYLSQSMSTGRVWYEYERVGKIFKCPLKRMQRV